ncbi:copia protein [Tanacetum coccineum]
MSSMKNLKDTDNFGDQFLYDKPIEDDLEKSKVVDESDSTIPDLSHQAITSTPPVIAPITDFSSPKPSSLVIPPPINTEATTITISLPEITLFIALQLRVARLEQEMSEVKKTNHSADNKREQGEEKQESSYSIRSTYKVALKEFDLKSALFKHMNKNQNANRNPANYHLYHALMKALIAYEDAMDKEVAVKVKDHKRKLDSDDDEDDDDDEGPSAGSNQGRSTKRRRPNSAASRLAQPPPKDDDQSSKKPQESDASASKKHLALTSTGWQITDIRDDVDEGHVLDLEVTDNAHIPKVSTTTRTGKKKLCKADLEGPAFNLVKAFHKNSVFLQFQMDECHKLLTNKVDLVNPEGDKERKIALSITKLKDARYLDFGLEELVPSLWVESERDYDISAAYGITHWWFRRKEFYINKHSDPSDREAVRSHMRILSVISVKVFEKYKYNYLREIILRRADYKEYKILEKDFKNLHPNDFEDLFLLNIQEKLNHLPKTDKFSLHTAVNMWIRNLVIRNRMGDLQLGIESYQTKINLERPNWDAADYYFKEDYTIVPKPRAVVYRDKNDQRKLMRLNELHNFSDGTLTRVIEKLDHMVKDFHLFEYNKGMETKKWSEDDKRRSKDFITVIEKRIQIRRIFRSLESFVGGRIRDIDYRLINRTTNQVNTYAARITKMIADIEDQHHGPSDVADTYPILLSSTRCGNKSILRVLRIILVILPKHPSETKVLYNKDGNPARANIKQALGSYERPHKGVKASANSDIVYFFTSAQDGDPLQDDVRLCLGDDLMKAQDHNRRQVKDESKDHYPKTEGTLNLGPERPRVYSDLSQDEKDRYNADIRATNIILQGLSPTDNLIENLTNTLALLSQSYKTFLPQTNNQLRTSSNPRNQATIQDGKVVVQNVQGRQNRGQGNNARGAGAVGYGRAQNRVGNANPGQARQVKCYNYNGVGHIARNCTQPKRPHNSKYFKDKMLLMQAQENGVVLDEEQLLFLAGGQDNAYDEDMDEQPVQDLALNVDNVFQADDYDAYDSDVDDWYVFNYTYLLPLKTS